MCIICIDLKKDNLTSIEASDNLSEMQANMTKEHIHEVLQLIWKKEDDEYAVQFYDGDLAEGAD